LKHPHHPTRPHRSDLITTSPIFPAIAFKEKAQALTGCVIGAIPPFSFNDQLQVLADLLILQNEEVVFNAGCLDRSIFMKLADYVRIAKPQIVKIALCG
jgi:Ala-tRNA(Pro) deacylase